MNKIVVLLLIGFSGFSQTIDTINIKVIKGAKLKLSPETLLDYKYEVKEDNQTFLAINNDTNINNNDFYKVLYNQNFYYINEIWIISDSTFLEFKKRVATKKEYLRHLIYKKDSLATAITEHKEALNEYNLQQKYLKKYGSKTYNKLKEGYYWIGMTKEMAIISLGEPNDINKKVSRTQTTEQWVYDNIYLYFKNGTLETYQN